MSKLKYFNGTSWIDVNGQITGDTLPIGSIIPYTSENAPAGWLVCIGQTLNKTTYPELFDVIGYTFGGEEGGDTFNLPNLKGRVIVGQDTSQTEFEDIGQTGGSKYLQAHEHTIVAKTQLAGLSSGGTGTYIGSGSTTTSSAGTGDSGNLQPYMVTNYIIKVKQSAGLIANVSNIESSSQTDTYSCEYINNCNIFLTGTEINTGQTWIDGKTIYRKVYNIGTLPNATTMNYSADLSWPNIFITKIEGIARDNTSGVTFPLNFANPLASDQMVGMRVTGTNNISVFTGADRRSLTGYVILEYTKNSN